MDLTMGVFLGVFLQGACLGFGLGMLGIVLEHRAHREEQRAFRDAIVALEHTAALSRRYDAAHTTSVESPTVSRGVPVHPDTYIHGTPPPTGSNLPPPHDRIRRAEEARELGEALRTHPCRDADHPREWQ